MNDIEKRISELTTQIAQATAASHLLESPDGKLIVDYVNERVSLLVSKMAGNTPLERDEYLDAHGAVKELKSFLAMLYTKPQQVAPAKEELDALREVSAQQ